MTTMRDNAKQDWTGDVTLENIKVGCLQRIADATEIMAQNVVALQNDRDYYKRECQGLREKNSKLERRIAALKGVMTRMKKTTD